MLTRKEEFRLQFLKLKLEKQEEMRPKNERIKKHIRETNQEIAALEIKKGESHGN